jgi:hypothetical protein
LARQLFDPGIFSALTSGGALGAGWELNFYTGGSTTRITTYNARSGGSANANPVVADASGRFDEIWIEDSQTIKWVLTDADGSVKVTVDDVLVSADAPSIASGLLTFLAGSAALPVASGGTGASSAVNALTNLGALPAAGGTVTGDITRSGKGIHPFFSNASMTGGEIFIQASGADPTSNPGDIVFEY